MPGNPKFILSSTSSFSTALCVKSTGTRHFIKIQYLTVDSVGILLLGFSLLPQNKVESRIINFKVK